MIRVPIPGTKRKEWKCRQGWCGPRLAKPGVRARSEAATLAKRERDGKLTIRISREEKDLAKRKARELDPIYNKFAEEAVRRAGNTNKKRVP